VRIENRIEVGTIHLPFFNQFAVGDSDSFNFNGIVRVKSEYSRLRTIHLGVLYCSFGVCDVLLRGWQYIQYYSEIIYSPTIL
jgi:hypothetical protein